MGCLGKSLGCSGRLSTQVGGNSSSERQCSYEEGQASITDCGREA